VTMSNKRRIKMSNERRMTMSKRWLVLGGCVVVLLFAGMARAAAITAGNLLVSVRGANEVREYAINPDGSIGSLVQSFSVPDPCGLDMARNAAEATAIGGYDVYVASRTGSDYVYKIDSQTGVVTQEFAATGIGTIPGGSGVGYLRIADGRIIVAKDYGAGSMVARAYNTSGATLATYNSDKTDAFGQGIVVNPDTGALLIATDPYAGDRILSFNVATGALNGQWAGVSRCRDLDTVKGWIATARENTNDSVNIRYAATGNNVDPPANGNITTNTTPQSIGINPAGTVWYLGDGANHKIGAFQFSDDPPALSLIGSELTGINKVFDLVVAVPEPATVVLLVSGGMFCLLRRRRR